MPHLTGTGTARRTSGDEQMGFGVPGYAHPLLAPTEWAELTRPGTPLHWAVLNIADGPGTRPDPHCLEAPVTGQVKSPDTVGNTHSTPREQPQPTRQST
ncbi:hypothetical protein ACWD3D_24425, partial [Streptomyces sp. NPDC002690]